jgi:hypothetical protein
MTTSYVVSVHGCDDSTYLLLDLTEDQAAAVQFVADAVNTKGAGHGCMPSMKIATLADADAYAIERATEDPEDDA